MSNRGAKAGSYHDFADLWNRGGRSRPSREGPEARGADRRSAGPGGLVLAFQGPEAPPESLTVLADLADQPARLGSGRRRVEVADQGDPFRASAGDRHRG